MLKSLFIEKMTNFLDFYWFYLLSPFVPSCVHIATEILAKRCSEVILIDMKNMTE